MGVKGTEELYFIAEKGRERIKKEIEDENKWWKRLADLSTLVGLPVSDAYIWVAQGLHAKLGAKIGWGIGNLASPLYKEKIDKNLEDKISQNNVEYTLRDKLNINKSFFNLLGTTGYLSSQTIALRNNRHINPGESPDLIRRIGAQAERVLTPLLGDKLGGSFDTPYHIFADTLELLSSSPLGGWGQYLGCFALAGTSAALASKPLATFLEEGIEYGLAPEKYNRGPEKLSNTRRIASKFYKKLDRIREKIGEKAGLPNPLKKVKDYLAPRVIGYFKEKRGEDFSKVMKDMGCVEEKVKKLREKGKLKKHLELFARNPKKYVEKADKIKEKSNPGIPFSPNSLNTLGQLLR